MNHSDQPIKSVFLILSRQWNPRCSECGARKDNVRFESYTVTLKKCGYALKIKRWGRICLLCRFKFADFGPVVTSDLSEGYVYAPCIPKEFLEPGERQLP